MLLLWCLLLFLVIWHHMTDPSLRRATKVSVNSLSLFHSFNCTKQHIQIFAASIPSHFTWRTVSAYNLHLPLLLLWLDTRERCQCGRAGSIVHFHLAVFLLHNRNVHGIKKTKLVSPNPTWVCDFSTTLSFTSTLSFTLVSPTYGFSKSCKSPPNQTLAQCIEINNRWWTHNVTTRLRWKYPPRKTV